MAVVYQGRDLTLERPVAIKVLREDLSQEATFQEKFQQEAKAAAQLTHPNLVTIFDFGFDMGSCFIVMEYVPGTDLKRILQDQGALPIDEALYLMGQACSGVGYAHRSGLVHCDIKPQNLLVTPDKLVKVVDFGISRALASISPDEKSAVVWASPHYFSPEQASGLPPSPASDVYSLGIILYEMVTGKLPFSAGNAQELAQMHRSLTPHSPRDINPEIPPELEQIIHKVLSKVPSTRYRTADQMGRVLSSFNQTRSAKKSGQPVQLETLENKIKPPIYSKMMMRQTPSPALTNPLDIDWITVLLGLLATVAIGGLIPFCLWVYLVFNPPFR